jgi:hypothetical protein
MLRFPVHLYPVAVRVDALEGHYVRLVVVLDDLDRVRTHAVERVSNIRGSGEPEPEVQERLRRADVLRCVQREVEAVRVADDDRAIGVPLGGGRVETEVHRVEMLASGRVSHGQAQMAQVHDGHPRDAHALEATAARQHQIRSKIRNVQRRSRSLVCSARARPAASVFVQVYR